MDGPKIPSLNRNFLGAAGAPPPWRTLWVTFFGFWVTATVVQVYAFFVPVIMSSWRLSHYQAGQIVTVTLVVSAFGGWLWGLLADRIGRMPVLRATMALCAVASGLTAMAPDFTWLLWARALQGLAFGGEWAVGIVLAAEMAPPAVRGRVLGFVQSAWALGWAAAALASLVSLRLAPPVDWHVSFAISVLPALCVLVARLMTPAPGRVRPTGEAPAWQGIFRAPHRLSTLKGCLLTSGIHTGFWTLATWLPTLMRTRKDIAPNSGDLGLACMIAGAYCGYFAGSWLSDTAGRRPALALLAVAGTALAAAYFGLPLQLSGAMVLSGALGLAVTSFYSAGGPVLAELFPGDIRGSAQGFCYNFGRGIAGAVAGTAGWMLDHNPSRYVILGYVAGAYLVVLIAALSLQETRGKDLTPPV